MHKFCMGAMMKIGLVGYGKAGQAAARVLVNDPGYELQWLWRRQGSETLPMEGHAGPLICGMENLDIGAWIVGHHDVIFGFPHQTVRLIHDSIRPEALGAGAPTRGKNSATAPTACIPLMICCSDPSVSTC